MTIITVLITIILINKSITTLYAKMTTMYTGKPGKELGNRNVRIMFYIYKLRVSADTEIRLNFNFSIIQRARVKY